MSQRIWSVALVMLIPFLLGIALLDGLSGEDPVYAQGIVYVDDDTCPAMGVGTQAEPFCRVQDGVDAAVSGDEIWVASGTYSGVQAIVGGYGYTYTQVIFVEKSLTLRGGYDAANWDALPDPVAHPTIIDARRQGRPLSIVGTPDALPVVAVAGFTLTGGDYTGLGNRTGAGDRSCGGTDTDCGGGLMAYRATLILRDMVISDNMASRDDSGRIGQGGGMYLWDLQADSSIENTTVISNSIGGGSYGGGIMIQGGEGLTLSQSLIADNRAFGSASSGGGLYIFQPRKPVIIKDSAILRNEAYTAGGLDAYLTYVGEALYMNRVTLLGNEATTNGTTIQIIKQGGGDTGASLNNILLAENRGELDIDLVSVIEIGGGSGGGLETKLAHVTAAGNQVPTFLSVEAYADYPVTAVLTNTLLVSFTNAFLGYEIGDDRPLTVTHTSTLTYNVALLHAVWAGAPAFTAVSPLTGDPMLNDAYRLQANSAAIDAGSETALITDLDGEPRPSGLAPDIGADEFNIYDAYLPTILR